MVYFLGRDVKVAICTEDADKCVEISSATPDVAAVGTATTGDIIEFLWGTDGNAFDGGSFHNPFTDVTGVDLTLGKVDEDIAYMGQRTALKAEIKNETTLVITKKRNSALFNHVFNNARHGIKADNTLAGNEQPTLQYGYRLAVQLKESEEVITLRNCVLADYTVALGADSVQEETLTFISYTDPLIDTAAVSADNADASHL
jgi:hypothetical protein